MIIRPSDTETDMDKPDLFKLRYDLPLQNDESPRFLVLIIGLIAFLSSFALYGIIGLNGAVAEWTAGLQGQATIEVQNRASNGTLLPKEKIEDQAEKLINALGQNSLVRSAERLSFNEIEALVGPWLSSLRQLDDLPIPILIRLQFNTTDPDEIADLSETISKIAPNARLDQHQEWLEGAVHFARGLQFGGLALLAIFGITLFTAIAGAVKARMEADGPAIELLHLIGSGDDYIARQFARHNMLLALKGSMIGVAVCCVLLLILSLALSNSGLAIAPDFDFGHALILLTLPFLCVGLAWQGAHRTVLQKLENMP